MNNLPGWLNVYKPINITSFGVLKKIKDIIETFEVIETARKL